MEQSNTNAFGIPQRNYQVKVSGVAFEGPLDLLLQLIERNELPVTEIALAKICDEYLRYIGQLTEINPAELADFLVIATKLLYIKSQALLPVSPTRTMEEAEDARAAEDLVEQLREYKLMKAAAQRLLQKQEVGRAFTTRRIGLHETMLEQLTSTLQQTPEYARNEAGLHGVQLKDLLNLVQRRLASQAQQQLKLPLTATNQQLKRLVHSVKIGDKIKLIQERFKVKPGARVEFSSLFVTGEESADAVMPSSLEVIVTFMAVLELVRSKQVVATQGELFGEIFIEKASS